MKYKPQAKSGLALLAEQSCVIRCWSFNGQLSAQTHHGTFTFKSVEDVRAWIKAMERGAA